MFTTYSMYKFDNNKLRFSKISDDKDGSSDENRTNTFDPKIFIFNKK